jgi:hypothetical protein
MKYFLCRGCQTVVREKACESHQRHCGYLEDMKDDRYIDFLNYRCMHFEPATHEKVEKAALEYESLEKQPFLEISSPEILMRLISEKAKRTSALQVKHMTAINVVREYYYKLNEAIVQLNVMKVALNGMTSNFETQDWKDFKSQLIKNVEPF